MVRKEYDLGFIYKLYNPNTNDFYIGSTYEPTKRWDDHRYNTGAYDNKKYNYKVYRTIRETGGWDNWRQQIIDSYYEITKEDLKDIEQDYIIKLNPNCNSANAKNNKDQLYKCECGSTILLGGLDKHVLTSLHKAQANTIKLTNYFKISV